MDYVRLLHNAGMIVIGKPAPAARRACVDVGAGRLVAYCTGTAKPDLDSSAMRQIARCEVSSSPPSLRAALWPRPCAAR